MGRGQLPYGFDQKKAQGFLPPAARNGCYNCVYVEDVNASGAPNDLWHRRCSLGHFGTQAYAICHWHDKAEPPPAPAEGRP